MGPVETWVKLVVPNPKPRLGVKTPFRLPRNTFRSSCSLVEEIGIEIALGSRVESRGRGRGMGTNGRKDEGEDEGIVPAVWG